MCREYSPLGCSGSTSTTPRVRVPRHVTRLVVNFFAYAARPGASARRAARRRLLCLTQARRQLLHPRRASGCLSTSRGSSRSSSSTTSPTPRVRVPQHVARLLTRLVVDNFAYAVRPSASARHAACRAARRRLLRLRRTSGCLGSSRGSSSTTLPRAGSSSTTSPTLRVRVPRFVTRPVVDYYAYAACPGASARRTAHRQLLRLRRASGCLGSSRGSSSTTSPRAGSSSTTSSTPRVWVPQHVARLVVDYFAYVVRPGASTRHAARRRLLCLRRASGCLGSSRGSLSTTSSHAGSSFTTSPTPRVRVPRHVARFVTRPVVDYFAYAARPGASARHAARRAARR
jgi:hypothetical protein